MKSVSIAWKGILACLIFLGIWERAGIFSSSLQLHTLLSFTTLSNIYCMVVLLCTLAVLAKPQGCISPALSKYRSTAVMMMVIVGVLYHIILLPNKRLENPQYSIFTFGNMIAHYIAPVGILLDWLLFDPKGRISKWDPLRFACIPLGYFTIASSFVWIASQITGRYFSAIYFFMNVSALGLLGILIWAVILFVFIVFLAYLVYAADYFLSRVKNRQNK